MEKRTMGWGLGGLWSGSMLKFYEIRTRELKAKNKRKKIKQDLCILEVLKTQPKFHTGV